MITAAVIGLGGVGSRNAQRSGFERLTHVGAILASGRYTLGALVDPDVAACEAAGRLWQGKTKARIAASTRDLGTFDVVAIAGPAGGRPGQIEAALALKPKVLIIEKPFAASLDEGRAMAARIATEGATFLVNFNRRFDPNVQAARRLVARTPRKALFRYGKGLGNYASHMVDFLIDWFGEIVEAQAIGGPIDDFDNVDFRLRLDAGFDVLVAGISGLDYDQFEMDFILADRRVELANAGAEIRIYDPVPGRIYEGYTQLGPASTRPINPVGGFVETYLAVADHLEMGAPLRGCGPGPALAGLAVIDALRLSASRGGQSIHIPRQR